ncbi:hypothetical protein PFISCL1PPCAC_16775, partial [Pristionchus fissidentatus]
SLPLSAVVSMSQLADAWKAAQVKSPQSSVWPVNSVRPRSNFNVVVAVWLKDGKPVLGQAWNDSGVLKCSFASDKKVMTVEEMAGGTISLLQYDGNHCEKGFFYEWIPLQLLHNQQEMTHRSIVECERAIPIFWTEKMILGYLDMVSGRSHFAGVNGSYHEMNPQEVTSTKLEVLVRNMKGGPPGCNCVTCNAGKLSHQRKLMHYNEWEDVKDGDILSDKKQHSLVKANTKGTGKDEKMQIVVLWYLHGRPLMGRGWIEDNSLRAVFVHKGKEYSGQTLIGYQVLVQSSAVSVGFEYVWMNFEQWSNLSDKAIQTPVQVGHVAPCIIFHEGKEVLGSLDMDTEVAEGIVDGKVVKKDGAAIKGLLILCRKDREDIVAL